MNNVNHQLSSFLPREDDRGHLQSLAIHAENDSSKRDITAPQAKATLVQTDPHFIGGFRKFETDANASST
ncbi:hypothetical protein ACHAXS_003299 [Conticribra weissflogii]